jgi:hypothetical protein
MVMQIDKTLKSKKSLLLDYFRNRADEFLSEIKLTFGIEQYKEQALAINKALAETKDNLIATLVQKATKEKWTNKEILDCILMITYTNYIVMLESRNDVWPYDYMAFSRRIGELWEPFCKLCFSYPVNNLTLFVPPLFTDVKRKLSSEIDDYINRLNITNKQKQQLRKYYYKVWGLVTSGEIKLELDLHFIFNKEKYVVDFKSGFSSNEKGNTNRLLLVGSIYKNLEENYKCIIFVRGEDNNHYYNTLKNSGVWETYSGIESYREIKKYSGYDIKSWITTNVNWQKDFKKETMTYCKTKELEQYLIW